MDNNSFNLPPFQPHVFHSQPQGGGGDDGKRKKRMTGDAADNPQDAHNNQQEDDANMPWFTTNASASSDAIFGYPQQYGGVYGTGYGTSAGSNANQYQNNDQQYQNSSQQYDNSSQQYQNNTQQYQNNQPDQNNRQVYQSYEYNETVVYQQEPTQPYPKNQPPPIEQQQKPSRSPSYPNIESTLPPWAGDAKQAAVLEAEPESERRTDTSISGKIGSFEETPYPYQVPGPKSFEQAPYNAGVKSPRNLPEDKPQSGNISSYYSSMHTMSGLVQQQQYQQQEQKEEQQYGVKSPQQPQKQDYAAYSYGEAYQQSTSSSYYNDQPSYSVSQIAKEESINQRSSLEDSGSSNYHRHSPSTASSQIDYSQRSNLNTQETDASQNLKRPCPRCGHANFSDCNFCGKCGLQLVKSPTFPDFSDFASVTREIGQEEAISTSAFGVYPSNNDNVVVADKVQQEDALSTGSYGQPYGGNQSYQPYANTQPYGGNYNQYNNQPSVPSQTSDISNQQYGTIEQHQQDERRSFTNYQFGQESVGTPDPSTGYLSEKHKKEIVAPHAKQSPPKPVICFGFGGTIVYSIPKRSSRYLASSGTTIDCMKPGPLIVVSVKEKLQQQRVKSDIPLDTLGPLDVKTTKSKEVVKVLKECAGNNDGDDQLMWTLLANAVEENGQILNKKTVDYLRSRYKVILPDLPALMQSFASLHGNTCKSAFDEALQSHNYALAFCLSALLPEAFRSVAAAYANSFPNSHPMRGILSLLGLAQVDDYDGSFEDLLGIIGLAASLKADNLNLAFLQRQLDHFSCVEKIILQILSGSVSKPLIHPNQMTCLKVNEVYGYVLQMKNVPFPPAQRAKLELARKYSEDASGKALAYCESIMSSQGLDEKTRAHVIVLQDRLQHCAGKQSSFESSKSQQHQSIWAKFNNVIVSSVIGDDEREDATVPVKSEPLYNSPGKKSPFEPVVALGVPSVPTIPNQQQSKKSPLQSPTIASNPNPADYYNPYGSGYSYGQLIDSGQAEPIASQQPQAQLPHPSPQMSNQSSQPSYQQLQYQQSSQPDYDDLGFSNPVSKPEQSTPVPSVPSSGTGAQTATSSSKSVFSLIKSLITTSSSSDKKTPKPDLATGHQSPTKANLGEQSKFRYDEQLKRWVEEGADTSGLDQNSVPAFPGIGVNNPIPAPQLPTIGGGNQEALTGGDYRQIRKHFDPFNLATASTGTSAGGNNPSGNPGNAAAQYNSVPSYNARSEESEASLF